MIGLELKRYYAKQCVEWAINNRLISVSQSGSLEKVLCPNDPQKELLSCNSLNRITYSSLVSSTIAVYYTLVLRKQRYCLIDMSADFEDLLQLGMFSSLSMQPPDLCVYDNARFARLEFEHYASILEALFCSMMHRTTPPIIYMIANNWFEIACAHGHGETLLPRFLAVFTGEPTKRLKKVNTHYIQDWRTFPYHFAGDVDLLAYRDMCFEQRYFRRYYDWIEILEKGLFCGEDNTICGLPRSCGCQDFALEAAVAVMGRSLFGSFIHGSDPLKVASCDDSCWFVTPATILSAADADSPAFWRLLVGLLCAVSIAQIADAAQQTDPSFPGCWEAEKLRNLICPERVDEMCATLLWHNGSPSEIVAHYGEIVKLKRLGKGVFASMRRNRRRADKTRQHN